ncbi:hypothetical protein [Spirosoma koreense]
MSLSEIKKRLERLTAERIRQTDEQLEKLRHRQQQFPSTANELMIQSLEYRKEKLKR